MTKINIVRVFCVLIVFVLLWLYIKDEPLYTRPLPKALHSIPGERNKLSPSTSFQVNRPHKKIMLWGYFRGGSSFVGKLLSASRGRYVFEPLQPYMSIPKNWTRLTKVLEQALSCQSFVCFVFPYTLAKVNRMEGEPGKKWLQHQTDIKVVHLLRDPRAILASREKSKKNVELRTMRNLHEVRAKVLCRNMMDDIKQLKTLPPNRYLLVKYESLMDHMDATLKIIYKFMDVPFIPAAIASIVHHSDGKESDPYSLNRNLTTFDKDKWKNLFTKEKIKYIEKECSDVMNYLNYNITSNIFDT